MASQGKILWADDEIELLKPHIIFLEQRGYELTPVTSGNEAVEAVQQQYFDIVFLDENMPGLGGLEALQQIKQTRPDVPVVLITKSEEEFLMESAIGQQISDYLIKPVNPNQILLTLKKLLENRKLVSDSTIQRYQQQFMQLNMKLNEAIDHGEWTALYRELVDWDLRMQKLEENGMQSVLETQWTEANANFSRYVADNYLDWTKGRGEVPVMSHNIIEKYLLPLLDDAKPTVMILIDNLRYDQYRALQPMLTQYFRLVQDDIYYSILPTATNYARNAIFAGMMPSEIEKRFPKFWVNDEEEGGKNLHEDIFLNDLLKRKNRDIKVSYNKITNLEAGKTLSDNLNNLLQSKLVVIVYNFVDLLSHVRTEMEVLKELAEDEAAYRSLAISWFEHSPLYDIIKKLAAKDVNLLITTDHGSIKVKKPVKIVGDRNTTTNLRYKTGKNLNYEARQVFAVKKPEDAGLPRQHVSSTFAFAYEDYFFVYPNNYNYYVNYYRNTFQHGGISLEEMLIPLGIYSSK